MYLPICYRPEEDELLYRWLLGLAEANGIGGYNAAHAFIDYYMKQELPPNLSYGNARKHDYLLKLSLVCRRYGDMKCFPSVENLMSHATILYALYPLFPIRHQVKRSELLLRERTGKLADIHSKTQDITELRVCPECMKEDRKRVGKAFYHTWHQILDVCVCAKHHVPLMRVGGSRNEFLDRADVLESMEKMTMRASEQVEIKIAEFCQGLYRQPVNIDLHVTQKLLLERMAQRGYPIKKPYGNLLPNMLSAGYGPLLGESPENRLSDTFTSGITPATEVMHLLSFLFENYEDFRRTAAKHENGWKADFLETVQGRFCMLSEFGQTVILKCMHCGNEFSMHPYELLMGLDCLECNKKLLGEQIINRELKFVGDGQYELVMGENGVSGVLHRTCGTKRVLDPRFVIYGDKECICSRKVEAAVIQRRIDSSGKQFTLM